MASELVEGFKVPVGTPHPIKSITLIPSVKGVFDVEVDGKLVFSKHQLGRHAEPGEVFEAIRRLRT